MQSDTIFPIVILTGLSGAGKSTALRVFEDMGFFCVDGLPVAMVPKLAELYRNQTDSRARGLALGMDVRQRDFLHDWANALSELKGANIRPQVIFIEADERELLRRYSETRRPHPLESEQLGLKQALAEEVRVLEPLRRDAGLVLDTSQYSIHDLRRVLQEKWAYMEEQGGGLRVHIVSFGFKYGGPPKEADLVFDMRFLPNPYFDPTLKALSGQDAGVAEYVLATEPGATFIERFLDFLRYLVPLYAAEGRYRLTVGVGCTGGRHRSVAVSERLRSVLAAEDYVVSLEHRHIDR